jgi:hypothetical protein
MNIITIKRRQLTDEIRYKLIICSSDYYYKDDTAVFNIDHQHIFRILLMLYKAGIPYHFMAEEPMNMSA